MASKRAAVEWMDYPATDDTRSGGKVGWRYYQTKTEAEACSKAARFNAKVKAEFGYDFGYCVPGSMRQLADERWEVCIP